jgi:hypothetical protein
MNQPARSPLPRQVPRLAMIALIVAVVALAAFADHPAPRRAAQAAGAGAGVVAAGAVMPVAAPSGALSSSWFCAGPIAAPAKTGDGRLVIANSASRPVHGRVTLIASNAPPTSQDVEVAAGGRLVVMEKTPNAAPYLGASVELDGGQAAVQQVVTGTEGTTSTSCATSGSTAWYFPAGTTQESSTLAISLLNPYADDAIVDLSFTTEQGQENPQDFQGIVVPAGSLVGLDLGSHLRRRAAIATSVNLRIGRVAAFETQVVQSQSAAAQTTAAPGTVPWPPGVTVLRGAPSASTSWWWPTGAASDGANEQYLVYNPGPAAAQVSLVADLDQGSADPFEVTVDPHGVAVVTTNSESRIPKAMGHGAGLHSANGVPVVAARLLLAASPANQTGVAEVLGSALEVRRWLVPGNGATDAGSATLVVYNPGSAPVRVTISSLTGPLDGQSGVVIPSHRRYLPPAASAGDSFVVAGNGPVVVEGDSSPAKGIGIDATIGVPLGE